MSDDSALYLDLMKRVLTNVIYEDANAAPWAPPKFDACLRAEGRDWPAQAHTMVGLRRLDNIQSCAESVFRENVPGDFVEAGVWRGGAAIFMRAVMKAHGVTDRVVWAADSFAGLPPPSPARYPADRGDELHKAVLLAASLETVKSNFERYGLLDKQVKFLKGWFRDTLPSAPVGRISLLRLDGDMYESTIDALTHLYPKVSPGGYVIIDDYHAVPGCKLAVDDYRRAHGVTEELVGIDWTGFYWRRR